MAVAVDYDDPTVLESMVDALEKRAEQLRVQRSEILQEAADMRARVSSIQRRPVEIISRRPSPHGQGEIPTAHLDAIVDVVQALGECTSTQIEEHTGLSKGQVRARLQRLEQLGTVRRTGLKRGTRWLLAGEGETSDTPGNTANHRTRIRDAGRELDVFTFPEMQEALPDISEGTIRRWIRHYVEEGVFYGERVGERVLYEYLAPERQTVNRRHRTPPEMEAAMQARRARRKSGANLRSGRRVRTGNQRSDELVRKAAKAGADISMDGKNHVIIKTDGGTARIAMTPGGSGSKAREKVKKLGIAV